MRREYTTEGQPIPTEDEAFFLAMMMEMAERCSVATLTDTGIVITGVFRAPPARNFVKGYRSRIEPSSVPSRWDWLARLFGLRHYREQREWIVEAETGAGWHRIASRVSFH